MTVNKNNETVNGFTEAQKNIREERIKRKEKKENLVKWMNSEMYTIAHKNPKIVERINDFNDTIEFDTPDGYRITVTIDAKKLTPEQQSVYEQ